MLVTQAAPKLPVAPQCVLKPPIARARGALLAALLVAGLGACSEESDCGPQFEEGERFRFTILRRVESDPNECVPLQPGDEYVLTAGMKEIDRQTCDFRPAAGGIIPQLEGMVDFCASASSSLGLVCWVHEGPRAPLSVAFSTPSPISSDMDTLEDGRVRVSWFEPNAGVDCVEIFAARIEALGRVAAE